MFESSVNSYDSQTMFNAPYNHRTFESSVNSYDSQTSKQLASYTGCLRVV